MRFHEEVGAILRRATELALLCGAHEVGEEHLLAGDPRGELPASPKSQELQFSSKVQWVMEKACLLARASFTEIVRKEHLEMAVMAICGQPSWGEIGNPPLTCLLNEATSHLLAAEGIRLEVLREKLAGLSYPDCMPQSDFHCTEAGMQFYKLSQQLSSHTRAQPVVTLMGCLLCQGPAAEALEAAGVTPPLLLRILEKF